MTTTTTTKSTTTMMMKTLEGVSERYVALNLSFFIDIDAATAIAPFNCFFLLFLHPNTK